MVDYGIIMHRVFVAGLVGLVGVGPLIQDDTAITQGIVSGGNAFVLVYFLKNVKENRFGVIWVADKLGNPQDVSTLSYVVLNLLIGALICELGHFYTFRGELLIEVVEVKGGRRKVF